MIKVLLYENNNLFKESIISLFDGHSDYKLMAAFNDCTDIVNDVNEFHPDVILLDIHIPHCNSVGALRKIKQQNNKIKVIMLVIFEDDSNIIDAIRYGASGYIIKKSAHQKLPEAIGRVYNNSVPMTASIARYIYQMFNGSIDRKNKNYISSVQLSILKHLSNGFSYKMTADKMSITLGYIEEQVKMVYEEIHKYNLVEVR